jgi:hypothetical protein
MTDDQYPEPRAELVPTKAPEEVPALTNQDGSTRTAVIVDPTQVRRPWRSTLRTLFQLVIALVTLLPFVLTGVYVDGDQAPAVVGQVLAVATVVTRVMALPQVETFLRTWAPWLAAAPATKL